MLSRVVLSVIVSFLIFSLIGLSQNAMAATSVTSCGTLDAPGTTYFLDNDLTASQNCIVITANNIIFDGLGHSITGSNLGTGIDVRLVQGGVIQNMDVTDFGVGISLVQSDHYVINDNTSSGNAKGIELRSTYSTIIRDNIANSNFFTGISLRDSHDISVFDNIKPLCSSHLEPLWNMISF